MADGSDVADFETGGSRTDQDGFGTRLSAPLRGVAALVEELEVDRFSGADARRLTELFAWGERLCATGKALGARRVAESGAWTSSGERSAAQWLARLSGQTTGHAAETLETALRLREQPAVDAAARAGDLSDQQGAAVTAAAARAPAHAAELLDTARDDNLTALRQRSQQIRTAGDSRRENDRHLALHAGRYLRSWTDPDGAGRLTGRFTPDALAVILSALKPFRDDIFDAARRAGTRDRPDARAADALVAMARVATGQTPPLTVAPSGAGPTGAGPCGAMSSEAVPSEAEPSEAEPSEAVPSEADAEPSEAEPTDAMPGNAEPPGAARTAGRPSRTAPPRPAMIIVRVDHSALVRGYRTADERCEIDGIGSVPVATVRAMATDAFLAAVVADGTDIRAVAHLGRQVTARQRTALLARDPECVVPGCHTRTGLEIDHVEA